MHHFAHAIDRHVLGAWIAIIVGVFVAIGMGLVAAFHRENNPDA